MPVPKDKVVAKLNEKYKGRSLSKDFKNKLADKWAEKIETEDDIDSFIDERDDIILETISESDRRAKQAADKAKEDAAKAVKGETKADETKEIELPDDTPQWMKAFVTKQTETINQLNQKIEGFQAAKSQETLAERFKKEFADSKVPESILKRYIPKTEDEFETAKQELSETWSALGVENRGRGFGQDRPTGNANQSSSKADDKPDEQVRAFAKAQNDKFLNSQKN